MNDLLETVGTVNPGCLILVLVNAGERGQVDDGVPADRLPDLGDDIDRPVIGRIHQPVLPRSAKGGDQIGDQAVLLAVHTDQCAGDDHGDEVGHIGDRLHGPLEFAVLDLVEKKSEQDGCRESEHDGEQGNNEGIADQAAEIRIGKEPLKPSVPRIHPGAALNASCRLVVLESDNQAVHGLVAEQGEVDQNRKNQDIFPFVQFPVTDHALRKRQAVKLGHHFAAFGSSHSINLLE